MAAPKKRDIWRRGARRAGQALTSLRPLSAARELAVTMKESAGHDVRSASKLLRKVKANPATATSSRQRRETANKIRYGVEDAVVEFGDEINRYYPAFPKSYKVVVEGQRKMDPLVERKQFGEAAKIGGKTLARALGTGALQVLDVGSDVALLVAAPGYGAVAKQGVKYGAKKVAKKQLARRVSSTLATRSALAAKQRVRRNPELQHELGSILSLLLVARRVYENAHWLASGESSYSDHLLFQRIYESTVKSVDKVAERLVGLYGSGAMFGVQSEVSRVMKNLLTSSVQEQASFVERELKSAVRNAYSSAQQVHEVGVEDLLTELASDRDEVVYLLNRRFGTNGDGSGSPRPAQAAALKAVANRR